MKKSGFLDPLFFCSELVKLLFDCDEVVVDSEKLFKCRVFC